MPCQRALSPKLFHCLIATVLVLCLAACGGGDGSADEEVNLKAQLGELLFHDTNLSFNRTQSCSTCHDPEHAFTDPRDNGVKGMASLGDDGMSLGDRNAPTAMYASFTPLFEALADGEARGGQFHDGRAPGLRDQAQGPPVSAIEMGMPNPASVMARIMENPTYISMFQEVYGPAVFDDTDAAFEAMGDAIAEFERTEEFAPFDSKWDRFLRGEYTLTPQEDLGQSIFFSASFANCNQCHAVASFPQRRELFTDHSYHNIAVPPNDALRAVNGLGMGHVDGGLINNPQVNSNPLTNGKYKTPTLRNVAVTGPYMHNGVFQDLRTVILFYDKFNNPARVLNPETGQPWRDPEVADTVSITELEDAPALTDERVDALIAFLKLLTDRRYEYLLDD